VFRRKLYHILPIQLKVGDCLDNLSRKALSFEEKWHKTMMIGPNPSCLIKFEIHISQYIIRVANEMADWYFCVDWICCSRWSSDSQTWHRR
jgi:hypothetical protein